MAGPNEIVLTEEDIACLRRICSKLTPGARRRVRSRPATPGAPVAAPLSEAFPGGILTGLGMRLTGSSIYNIHTSAGARSRARRRPRDVDALPVFGTEAPAGSVPGVEFAPPVAPAFMAESTIPLAHAPGDLLFSSGSASEASGPAGVVVPGGSSGFINIPPWLAAAAGSLTEFGAPGFAVGPGVSIEEAAPWPSAPAGSTFDLYQPFASAPAGSPFDLYQPFASAPGSPYGDASVPWAVAPSESPFFDASSPAFATGPGVSIEEAAPWPSAPAGSPADLYQPFASAPGAPVADASASYASAPGGATSSASAGLPFAVAPGGAVGTVTGGSLPTPRPALSMTDALALSPAPVSTSYPFSGPIHKLSFR